MAPIHFMPRVSRCALALVATHLSIGCANAQQSSASARTEGRTESAITVDDLRHRVALFAHDSMMGRAAGTRWNDVGTDYIARELARLGLRPAGEGGTYFQQVMVRRSLRPGSSLVVDGHSYRPWRDFLPRDARDLGGSERDFSGGVPVVYGGRWGDSNLVPPNAVAGKAVIFAVPPLANGQPGWQANRGLMSQRYRAAALILIASLDAMPTAVRAQLAESSAAPRGADGPVDDRRKLPAFAYVTRAMADRLFGQPLSRLRLGTTGQSVRGSIAWHEADAPGRNVVAVLPGSDPALRGQYVAIGSHNDHVGFTPGASYDHDSLRAANRLLRPEGAEGSARTPTSDEARRIRTVVDSIRRLRAPRRDSIFNGADDDASGAMAMLEVAEALALAPPRRSTLFVWHTGEELGLYGAQYFTDHPTVPRDSITAQINVDMIGRGGVGDVEEGGPAYLQLIGSRRLSSELGDIIEAVNQRRPRPFVFDYQYDARGHPQQFYCRSDHYMYARYGIPVVFMSTGGHVDYHMVTDEPQYIDYDKLRDVTEFMRDVVVAIANRTPRLMVDKPKPDPRADCVQ